MNPTRPPKPVHSTVPCGRGRTSRPLHRRQSPIRIDREDHITDIRIPLPPGPSFFRFSEAAECRRCLTHAGFGEIEVAEIPMTWTLLSAAALLRAAYEGTVRTLALLDAQTADARAAIDAAMAAAAQAYATPHGALEIPMSAVLATGRES